jgi:hypothetical protein
MTDKPTPSFLEIQLLSDATFSRGEGTAGVADTEVEHDEFGMPFIGGKTVRALLRDSWLSMCKHFDHHLACAAERVLGRSRALDGSCRLRISDALLPEPIRETIRNAVERQEQPLTKQTILAGFTDLRHQTAENRATGAPETTMLRCSRVVLRGFRFESRLSWLDGHQPGADDLRVLALCALATRHGGLLRNRGRGHIRVTIDGELDRTRRYIS